VALARALATAPRLLLLDEPLTSLDPETAAGIRSLLRAQLSETGTTALVATHDAVDAESLAGRLVVLEGGRITQQGDVRAVLEAPATLFVAAVAATLPGREGWSARVDGVQAADGHVVVRARTRAGEDVELRMPPDAGVTRGAIITVRWRNVVETRGRPLI